jgi:periplasmic copper chaperone A
VRRIARAAAVLVVAAVVATGCGTARSQPATLTISDAWATATVEGAKRAYVYFTVTSDSDDAIVGAAVPAPIAAATFVEGTAGTSGHLGHLDTPGGTTHTHTTVPRIALPKGATIQLAPGVDRVVLTGLVTRLKVGDAFVVNLTFASGTTRNVTVVAR